MITKAEVETMLDAINDIVGDDRPWKEKRDFILSVDQDKTNFLEFISWFEDAEVGQG